MKKMCLVICSFSLIIFCSGCADKRVKVSGKVTVAGKGPLTGGSIRFVSASDPAKFGSGTIKAEGDYEIFDAPVGECKIVIDNSQFDPKARSANNMPSVPGKMGMGPPGKMGGMPGVAASGPNATDAKKMGSAPNGLDLPSEMNRDQGDPKKLKFVPFDASYSKVESTPLKQSVPKEGGVFNFDLKQ